MRARLPTIVMPVLMFAGSSWLGVLSSPSANLCAGADLDFLVQHAAIDHCARPDNRIVHDDRIAHDGAALDPDAG